MRVTLASLLAGAQQARGTAVVVDVFRAFTCAPLMFSLGIKASILVAKPEQALALKQQDPDLVLVGEVGGEPIAGFDLGNSPSQILTKPPDFFAGRVAVQRTSAGVQGALAALEAAEEVLLGSFGLARATAEYLRRRPPKQVSIVAMGVQLERPAPEDEWCARYLAHLLGAGDYDYHQAMREILADHTTQKFLRREKAYYPAEDPILCLQPDLYDFVLRAAREGEQVVVRKVAL
ncbi:MAG: 2-phosphosulfolactate phosphatase [Desulfarculus sp.]|nr:MAG: 2-phosphosulfolactate phosphatase [Desulfarculus sp.]